MADRITDYSFNTGEVNAATEAVIKFAGEVIEFVDSDELIELLNNQLTEIWHILNEDVRASILVTTFAEYDLTITETA